MEATDAVRRWVIAEASGAPGLAGAIFDGSINWLADEDPFPAHADQVAAFLPRVWEAAEAIMAANPCIEDGSYERRTSGTSWSIRQLRIR